MRVRNKIRLWGFTLMSCLLFITHAHADENNHCTNNQTPGTYHAEPGDLSTPTQLEVVRTTSELHSLRIEVCSGEVRVVPAPSSNQLHIQVTAHGNKMALGDFLQQFSTTNGEATLVLSIPKKVHPIITLFVPQENETAINRIDLGQGTLRLSKDALRGNRELNVGAGSVYVELDETRDYARLATNIGMGHLSDNRPGGHGGFFVVSKDTEGEGQGLLQINVGAGSIHLVPKL